jgi:DNA topoisomerase VI subunit B
MRNPRTTTFTEPVRSLVTLSKHMVKPSIQATEEQNYFLPKILQVPNPTTTFLEPSHNQRWVKFNNNIT